MPVLTKGGLAKLVTRTYILEPDDLSLSPALNSSLTICKLFSLSMSQSPYMKNKDNLILMGFSYELYEKNHVSNWNTTYHMYLIKC